MENDPAVCLTRISFSGQTKGMPSIHIITQFFTSAPSLVPISAAIKPSYVKIDSVSINLQESLVRKTAIYDVTAHLNIERGFEGTLPYMCDSLDETHITDRIRGNIRGHVRSGQASQWLSITPDGW
ncbi:MAG: putative matrix protein [Wenzhou bat rhabdovirus 2]|nr:MAG: putative matrix protein [Wenzhou bat rhabdovirus 2]